MKRKTGKSRCYIIAENADETPPAKTGVSTASRRNVSMAASRQRIAMASVAFVAAFSVLGARLAIVAASPDQSAGRQALAAGAQESRPDLVDRNGVLLAVNLPLRTLEISGAEVWNATETAAALAEIFPAIDRAELEAKLAAGRYVEIQEQLTPADEEAVFALGLPGVRFSPRVERYYPQGAVAAHVVGHTEPGKGGIMGLERVLDSTSGDAPLVASLDVRVQQVLEEELDRSLKKFHAKAAFGVMMDVSNGEIIALASLPDFDPNAPGAASADYRRNRVTYDRYELGSAFKIITVAAALDSGVATERSVYDARGSLKVADKIIRDFHPENRILTLAEVVQHSSNIGAARIAGEMGAARFRAAIKSFGLADPLPIEIHERRSPELPWQWGPVENATISYGHGISVTQLHLLAAVSATVNGGVWRAPTFLRAAEAPEGRRVVSEETSLAMRRILRSVITSGTASLADAKGYDPIGKTATAEKAQRGGYNRNARIASFVGAFPGDAPRYAVMVTLDEPQAVAGTYGYATAGWNAAPTFGAVVARAAPILGVMPVDEPADLVAFVEPLSEARKP
jgi:cell division protein FtsI (penicillin-binding protein 3)